MIEGYLTLFLGSFAAATILPLSSEAAVAALIATREFDPAALWATASIGNTLGAILNWLLGRFCLRWKDRAWFPVKPPQIERAGRCFARYGVWMLLLSWLPVLGDPLTFVAGLLRVRFALFLALVFAGKAGRYAALILLAEHAFG